jgi:hypothetical protein
MSVITADLKEYEATTMDDTSSCGGTITAEATIFNIRRWQDDDHAR